MTEIMRTRQMPVIIRLLRAPDVTVARLTLASYLRSGWMWGEFVLVLACFAVLYFPFRESTIYFNGTSLFCLGALAIVGPTIMVRQATGARTYLLLARLTSRAAYCRGLMLAAVALRLPLYLFFFTLVLLLRRLTDTDTATLLWGVVGIVPSTMLVAVITVGLCPPMATRRQLIVFLIWVTIMLFSFQPIVTWPAWVDTMLSIARLPLWPLQACYALSVTHDYTPSSLLSLLLLIVYAVLSALVASRRLEKRELLLY